MATRTCCSCHLIKDIDLFGWKNKTKGIRHSYCKVCKSKYSKTYYENNKDLVKANAINRNTLSRQQYRVYILDYLSSHPCVDCGESDPIVLEFDHVNGDKEYTISNMSTYKLEKIVEEISKCEVRCANCHKRRHAKENNSYKYVSMV